ncbi:MAG: trigger factor [Bacteroidetes bacterium]|nr:trigger factor [Bacteroidota bacterium]MDA1121744.1 trigger factor [Bacteroidota bacterium]
MEITLDKITQTEALIKINLKQDDYQPKVDEKVREYSKKANLKGFRQGKVPIGVIKKMFGKAIIAEEINDLLSRNLNEYIKEHDLQLLSDPEPNQEKVEDINWEDQKEFEFEYSVGLAGEFELRPEQLTIKKYTIKVNAKLIDETIENLRKQHGTMINPEISEAGDIIFGDIKHITSETMNTHAIDLNKVDKKERSKLVGVKKDDVVIFDMKRAFKDNHQASHLLNVSEDEYKKMKGPFEILVKNINRQIPADINQELFDKIYGPDQVKDEAEFREKIEVSIGEDYKYETEIHFERSIQKALLEKTKIQLPEAFLKSKLVDRSKNDEQLTEDYINEHFSDYMNDVKWSLFQNRIIKKNNLKVEHEEVVEKSKELIRRQFGASPQFAEQLESSIDQFAHNYLTAEEGKNYRQLYSNLINQKVFESLKSHVKAKEKSISAEDFSKLEV